MAAPQEAPLQNTLIIGGEHADRINYATEFAQMRLCLKSASLACHACLNCRRVLSHTHPNLVWVSPPVSEQDENSNPDQYSYDSLGLIKIDQVRRIVTEHHQANFEKGFSIFIITHMHRTTVSAANALLKVIEENHPQKIFVALAPSRASVLPTIASRLMCYPIKPAPLDLIRADQSLFELIIKISTMAPKERFLFCSQWSSEREALMGLLNDLCHTCHIMLRSNALLPRLALGILEALTQAKNELKRNLNPRLVTEQLLLSKWPKS